MVDCSIWVNHLGLNMLPVLFLGIFLGTAITGLSIFIYKMPLWVLKTGEKELE